MSDITKEVEDNLDANNNGKLEKVDFALISSSPIKNNDKKKRKKSTKKSKRSKRHKVVKPDYQKTKFIHFNDINDINEINGKKHTSRFLPGLLVGTFIGSAVTNFILEGLK